MNRKINVWGRNFDLKVIFDVYKGEEVLDIQKEALDCFVNKADDILSSYKEVEKYCLDKDSDLIRGSISNIFKYVMPESIFVKRDVGNRIVILLCNYRFDEEHGISVTFENEKFKLVSTQDDI